MKKSSSTFPIPNWLTLVFLFVAAAAQNLRASPAPVLLNEEFGTIPGWTAVKPLPNYTDWSVTTSAWGYDQELDALYENSNIYSDDDLNSHSRLAVMLINDTVPPTSGYEYKSRVIMVDNDACGLIFGYTDENTFYRLTFQAQNSTYRQQIWPFYGWNLDRMTLAGPTDLAGQSFGTNNFIPTVNVPFDVTIAVTNDHVWVTVDATPFVTDFPLPTTPSGKVGLFSWGMSATAPNVGFGVTNRSLSPIPLADPRPWQNLITPDSTNGNTWGAGALNWARTIDGNGNGFLRAITTAGDQNIAAFRTNFRTAAYVYTNNTAGWSNYVMHTRFTLTDDDGHGIYLRYMDPSNYVRVAFRSQTGTVTTGVKAGTSMQACSNLVFKEIYLLAGSANAPTHSASPVHDLYAVIQTNTLWLHHVQSQDGVSSTVTKGPISVTNHPTGGVGVWGWFQVYTDYDWVKVYEITNTPLFVQSPYGPVEPPVGMNDLPVGSTVNAYAPDAFPAPGTRRRATGYRRTYELGNAVSSLGTNATFTLNQVSTLRWDWGAPEHQLNVSASAGGTVNFLGSVYVPDGAVSNLVATPNAGFMFMGWAGLPSANFNPNLSLTMSRSHTVLAKFAADSDGDGLADDWETTYLGSLFYGAAGDLDGDGRNNLLEFKLGTNPNSVETLVATDGLVPSRWINEGRDLEIPGRLIITNFGGGFRGLFDESNQGLGSSTPGVSGAGFPAVNNVSFQSPLFVVRSNYWNNDWLTNFSLQVEYSVGDNDGACIYFRYYNESNYYRVTLDGQGSASTVNPIQGVSVQKRTNGYWAEITTTSDISYTAPTLYPEHTDSIPTKRLKITVAGTNDTFEVILIGWNTNLNGGLGDWDPAYSRRDTFTDTDIPNGRIGFSEWAQGEFTSGLWIPRIGNPVGKGWFADNITVTNSDALVFSENWETATLSKDFPPGWTNAYAGNVYLDADWRVSAHQTLANMSSVYGFVGTLQTGAVGAPKTDAESPILLAPSLTNVNYLLELGITPWDVGGMGFVYDFVDVNNFSRVMFDAKVPTTGELAQGVNIGRKVNGIWTDILVGDTSFIYTGGRAFDVRFGNNNGVYSMAVWNTDAPATVYNWQWTNAPTASTNYGLAVWKMPDAHYTYTRAYSLTPASPPAAPFYIANITLLGGNVILDISKPSGSNYHVLRATDVVGPYVTNAANQSGDQYSEAAPTGSTTYFYRLQLLQ